MVPDTGLEATRAVRKKISREHGNDPRRLIEHYMEYQQQFGGRLRWATGSDEGPAPQAESSAPADGAPRRG
ncbi:MAG: hypothetical protein HY720_11475 [Planctomycetes bacterium]|nr:hypothetical protein [Planctomycetota bacterium]